jgi:hypothetical protein
MKKVLVILSVIILIMVLLVTFSKAKYVLEEEKTVAIVNV